MPDLRKGLHVGSIDVVRVVGGVGNTEAARDDEVTGPCSRRPNQLLEDGDLITRSILDVIERLQAKAAADFLSSGTASDSWG